MPDELLGYPEASQLTGIPESTLMWYRATGTGPRSWKAGRRVRYWPKDVLDWLEAQEKATAVGGVK